MAAQIRQCIECKGDYTPTAAAQKYCSARCYEVVARRRKAKREPVYVAALQYAEMLVEQEGKCRICGGLPKERHRLAVDHDHETGKIRGLLCGWCNTAIGLLKDDPHIVLNAALYLEHHKD